MKKLNANVVDLAKLAIETRIDAEKKAERQASLRTGLKAGHIAADPR
jgi:hypothetical protein